VNSRDKTQQTPLHVACYADNLEMVRLLLRKDAEVNVHDKNGWTPLHCAASAGKFAICNVLLMVEDIDCSSLNKDGTSPLHYLVRRKVAQDDVEIYLEVLDLMMEKGAEVNTQTKHGESPLHQAALHANKEALTFLIDNKANIDILNKIGETPLHYALQAVDQEEVVKLLLDRGANPSLRAGDGGHTPLEIAQNRGLPKIAQLIEAAIDRVEAAKPKPGEPESLIIRILGARNLVPLADGQDPEAKLLLTFGDEHRTVPPLSSPTRSPKWKCEFLFPVYKKTTLGRLRLVVQDSKQASFLGQLTLLLDDMNLIKGGSKQWHYLKKSRAFKDQRVTGKIRLGICLIDCDANVIGHLPPSTPKGSSSRKMLAQSVAVPNTQSSPSASSASSSSSSKKSGGRARLVASAQVPRKSKKSRSPSMAFGVTRGKCNMKDCDCDAYQPEDGRSGGPCFNCGHYPAKHENLGVDAAQKSLSDTAPVKRKKRSSASSSSSSSSSSRQPASGSDSVADLSAKFSSHAKSTLGQQMTHSWEIDASELNFKARLGEGTAAKVFKGAYRGQDVAIKVLKEKIEAKQLLEFQKEFLIMASLRSPHVVFFYGACVSPSLCMVMEFCARGSLYDVLVDPKLKFDWPLFHRVCADMMRGVACLHSWKPQIVHRDLKSLNLLLDEKWTVKVCDFGLSRFSNASTNQSTLGKLRGTYAYCAPELYFAKKFTTKADIYSVGVILWEMAVRTCTGKYSIPYSEYKQLVFDFQIIIQTAKKDLRPTFPKNIPPVLKELISRCWDPKPENRPETSELITILQEVEKNYQDNQADWDRCCFDILKKKKENGD